MIETKHTPGPWRSGDKLSSLPRCQHFIAIQTDEYWIAFVTSTGTDTTEDVANARLIAAAPDLLEALKAVVAIADRKTIEFDRARAAIAKATTSAGATVDEPLPDAPTTDAGVRPR